MHFVDECVILVKGGDGGNGIVAFDAGPGRPRGGPTGGDGGNGGSVILVAQEQMMVTRSSIDLPSRVPRQRGEHGGGAIAPAGGRRSDRRVPRGVVVRMRPARCCATWPRSGSASWRPAVGWADAATSTSPPHLAGPDFAEG